MIIYGYTCNMCGRKTEWPLRCRNGFFVRTGDGSDFTRKNTHTHRNHGRKFRLSSLLFVVGLSLSSSARNPDLDRYETLALIHEIIEIRVCFRFGAVVVVVEVLLLLLLQLLLLLLFVCGILKFVSLSVKCVGGWPHCRNAATKSFSGCTNTLAQTHTHKHKRGRSHKSIQNRCEGDLIY